MEQGSVTDCVYCTVVHPALGEDCPRCGGTVRSFRPARMVDGPTSRAHVLSRFFRCGEVWMALDDAPESDEDGAREQLRDALVSLLEDVSLYGFDPGVALAEAVRLVEDEGALGPSQGDGPEVT